MKEAGFVFVSAATSKFIATDSASGGYPYETDNIMVARVWTNIKHAFDYHGAFQNKMGWILHRVSFSTERVVVSSADIEEANR